MNARNQGYPERQPQASGSNEVVGFEEEGFVDEYFLILESDFEDDFPFPKLLRDQFFISFFTNPKQMADSRAWYTRFLSAQQRQGRVRTRCRAS